MGIELSVLVPVFNVERYLEQCLESLCAQHVDSMEVICVDDGSTDGSGAILDHYAHNYAFISVIHKVNSGYGASMNIALNAAQGTYIGILESDDFASSRMYRTLLKKACAHDLDMVRANYIAYADGRKERIGVYTGFPYGKVIDPLDYPGLLGTTPSIWNGIYRKQMLDENGIRFVESAGASFQDTGFAYKTWMASKRVMLLRQGFVRYRTDNADSSVKSRAKVYALCDEHASVATFLEGVEGERRARFVCLMQEPKLGTYRWNFNRINEDERAAFLEVVAIEYREAKRCGLLDERLFKPQNWALLQQIMDDPRHVSETYSEMPWQF